MAVTCRNLYHFNPLQLGYDPRVKFFTVVYYSAKCSLIIASPCEYLSVKEERRRKGEREREREREGEGREGRRGGRERGEGGREGEREGGREGGSNRNEREHHNMWAEL